MPSWVDIFPERHAMPGALALTARHCLLLQACCVPLVLFLGLQNVLKSNRNWTFDLQLATWIINYMCSTSDIYWYWSITWIYRPIGPDCPGPGTIVATISTKCLATTRWWTAGSCPQLLTGPVQFSTHPLWKPACQPFRWRFVIFLDDDWLDHNHHHRRHHHYHRCFSWNVVPIWKVVSSAHGSCIPKIGK